jgi:cytochrome c553
MSQTQNYILLVSLTLTALSNSALADGAAIALHGNDRGAPACVTCHGTHGEGMPANGFPRLAGQNAEYLRTQLNAFAKGERGNAMMTPIAQTLSENERVAVAGYFAGMGGAAALAETGRDMTATGARLANQGRWSQGLPACVQCHGALGTGVGTTFPALAGQSSLYIENQLRGWQLGRRPPGPLGLMKVIASKLSAADIQEVASYFSTLPAGDPVPSAKR